MIKVPPYTPTFPEYSTYSDLLSKCKYKIEEIIKYDEWTDISDLLALLIICGSIGTDGSPVLPISLISTDVEVTEIAEYKMEDLKNLEQILINKIKNKKTNISCKYSNKNKNSEECISDSVNGGETIGTSPEYIPMNFQKQINNIKTHFKGRVLGFSDLSSELAESLIQGKGTRLVNDTYNTRATLVGSSNLNRKEKIIAPLLKNRSSIINKGGYFVLQKDSQSGVFNLKSLRKEKPITFKVRFNGMILTTKIYYYDEIGNIFPIAQLVDKYPEYASLEDLVAYGKPKFPQEYVNEELKKTIEQDLVVDGTVEEYKDVKFYSTPSLNRIRHFRIDELYYLYDNSPFLQNLEMYDGSFNELEILGTWLYFSFVDVPSELQDFFSIQLKNSNNGMTLRARLKILSTSMKRWLPFWEEFLKTDNIYSFLEIETILGYIVSSEYSETHHKNLETTIEPTYINYIPGRNFLVDYEKVLTTSWKIDEITIKDLDFETYQNSWDLWTTSGSASEVYLYTKEGKKVRINKSAIPVVITKKQLHDNRVQPYNSLLKSEVGKVRIAYSAPTYDSLLEGYILYKYSSMLVDCDRHDYVSFSNSVKLDFSIGVSSLLGDNYFGSTDIEKNDFTHDTYLDMYGWALLLKDRIQDIDIPLFLDLSSRKSLNWVFVRDDLNIKNVDYKTEEGTYLLGRGGVMSGRRATTFINNLQNSTFNNLAGYLLSETGVIQYKNYYGGDDSLCRASSYYNFWARMTINSKMMLVVNPVKSYVSSYNSEFFRVATKKDLRQGYCTRIIHSIIASNPVSKQEIDKKNRVKAMYNNLQMFVRRGGKSEIYELINLYSNIAKVPLDLLPIPVSSGGIGIGKIVGDTSRPGIPQFKDNNDKDNYKLNLDWFSQLNFREDIPLICLEQVEDSYKQDMVDGIKDINSRNERKDKYKMIFNSFLNKFKINKRSINLKKYLNKIRRMKYEINMKTGELKFDSIQNKKRFLDLVEKKNKLNPLAHAINYKAASDVINRYRSDNVKQKIQILLDYHLIHVSSSYINQRSGQLLLSEIVSNVSTNGIQETLSPDSTSYRKVNSYNMIGMEYLEYSTCVYLQYIWKCELVEFTRNLVGGFQRW